MSSATRRGPQASRRSASDRRRQQDEYDDLKLRALQIAGGPRCIACGESDPVVLQIDHKHHDGAYDRRRFGSGTSYFRAVVRGQIPPANLQVLCANDHARKTAKEKRYGLVASRSSRPGVDTITEPVV